jgi:superfamily II DNA or RNA helicase
MILELKDYQLQAAAKVTSDLRKASKQFGQDGEHGSVSLSAPTGAGKTVIAAAVIERILFGDPDTDAQGDPNAVFLWLTDDPALNEQTRKKLRDASGDRLSSSNLITLDDGFDQPLFDSGKVYFLNIQKVRSGANLITRREGRRRVTLWETINNTINNKGAHYYLVIDEAHRGTGRRSGEDQTITQRLLNGSEAVRAAPIVLGITATPARFDAAIAAGSQDRVPRKWAVPVSAVRESGLIKDVLSISYQGETQDMETTLVRQAVASLRNIDTAWNAFTEAEDEPPVRPALVFQIPTRAQPDAVGLLLNACLEEWPELAARGSIAHALESHTAEQFGQHSINYVAPQDIQDHPAVRLILFKQALTTGWDCPRAEVMVSLQTANDATYIAQLIGRMVRSPLARRIESDETLNRVRLFLPHFDRTAVVSVKTRLESDDDTGIPTTIEVNSVDAARNPELPPEAFEAIDGLPSYVVPGPVHRSQVTRLHKLAALLVGDSLLPDAISVADAFLVAVIETERERLEADASLTTRVTDIETITVEVMDLTFGEDTPNVSIETYGTDSGDLNRLFAAAKRRLRDGLAERYWGNRVQCGDDPYDAKTLTIALASDPAVVSTVEESAASRVRQWLDTHGDAISMLSEDKKARYAEVRAMARVPEEVLLGLPRCPISMSGDTDVPAYKLHMYSDSRGDYRCILGTWEQHSLAIESERSGFVAWYRNPKGGQRSLRVPYESSSGYKPLYPDIVVLHRNGEGSVVPSIIDPHGHHLGDAGEKLRGLAAFAERHGESFARIIGVIRDTNNNYRLLDLKDSTIRALLEGVNSKDAIEALFAQHGSAYE